jgi:phosphatidylserine/phosphatidylglycerophosphate/cardiolipin synthase-like enzyme
MEVFASKEGVSLYCYKGDAMTLLAFDLEEDLTENFAGFTIKVKADSREFYIYNKMRFRSKIKLHKEPAKADDVFSSEYSPIQKFRWVHVPSTRVFVENPYFGEYTYEVTPRYIVNGELLPPDKKLTVKATIDVSPFTNGDIQVGFSRAFVSSQAFANRFGNQLSLRPKKNKELSFDIKEEAGIAERWSDKKKRYVDTPFTYEEIHEYLGWQARDRVMGFLDEVLKNKQLKLDVFAYDLNEPTIIQKLLILAKQGRLRIILDDYPNHKKKGCFEMLFDAAFKKIAKYKDHIFRGNYSSQAHSKVFIQRKKTGSKPVKVLTGSTNFTTNGLYVNANHAIIFNNASVARLYANVFDASFGDEKMDAFQKSKWADKNFEFSQNGIPEMSIGFAPHPKVFVDELFERISSRILEAKSDVLFAVMIDNSNSSILDALRTQVEGNEIFTYGITDERENIQLYKPNSKRGVKISALKIATHLGQPFKDIVKSQGHTIHHKFVVVDFKGTDPVVYCGSSNLAYNPEQKNGDNLLEIRDKDVVTTFAIEAIRLIDHFHWLNRLTDAEQDADEKYLRDNTEKTKWVKKYYNPKDLRCVERCLLMK